MEPRPQRCATVFAGLIVAACCACASHPLGHGSTGSGTAGADPTTFRTIDRILQLEDARRDPGGELLQLMHNPNPRLRARAALALGRFERRAGGSDDHGQSQPTTEATTEALVAALKDGDRRVREMAAFGLGLRGDEGLRGQSQAAQAPSVSMELLAHWQDPDPDVRSALVEAATRLRDPDLVPHVLAALGDPNPRVRAAAAIGAHRWPWVAGSELAAEVSERVARIDGALLTRTLCRTTYGDTSPLGDQPIVGFEAAAPGVTDEPETIEVVTAALFSLQRRRAGSARAGFLRWARAEAPFEARLYATQGLARTPLNDAARSALQTLSADSDWRVAVEAVKGLGAVLAEEGRINPPVSGIGAALGAALGHPNTNVRVVAWTALGRASDPRPVASLLSRYSDEDAPPARAAALATMVRLRGARAMGEIRELTASKDVTERSGAAAAAALLPTEDAAPLLLQLSQDPHPKVASAAIGGMAEHLSSDLEATQELRRRLRGLLEGPDAALRLAAALTLRDVANADDLPSLQIAAMSSRGDAGPEARFEAARTLARIGGAAAGRSLLRLAQDPDPYVARVAAALAAAQDPPLSMPTRDDREPGTSPAERDVARAWRGADPRVTFVTNRGELTFRLLPQEAPQHVASVMALIRRGAYAGTAWHRVVPDFVIQGGGGRGDGNGGGTWRGPDDALRLEVTRRGFRTGTLGMPRNEDPDSGGRQIFVTHRPTPHLDGRYTVFGELEAGFEVLAKIVEGDVILGARVEP